MLLGIK